MSDGCDHGDFHCEAEVYRLQESEDGPAVGFGVELKIHCNDCGQPFAFLGLPGGLCPDHPTASFDRRELRAPIAPYVGPLQGVL